MREQNIACGSGNWKYQGLVFTNHRIPTSKVLDLRYLFKYSASNNRFLIMTPTPFVSIWTHKHYQTVYNTRNSVLEVYIL